MLFYMIKFSSYFSGRNFMLLAVTIFLIYLISVIFRKYLFPKINNTGFSANKEFLNKESGSSKTSAEGEYNSNAEILFFYADWCPHCKTAKPHWEKFKEEYNGKVVNKYKLNLIDVNCTSELGESGELIKTYDVEGFPTIKMNANGKIIEYEAKVTQENLNLFVKKML